MAWAIDTFEGISTFNWNIDGADVNSSSHPTFLPLFKESTSTIGAFAESHHYSYFFKGFIHSLTIGVYNHAAMEDIWYNPFS